MPQKDRWFGHRMQVLSNGLTFEVETHGPKTAPAVLLTMGLGMQLVAWSSALINALVDAGFRVIIYDNRDIGLSSHLDQYGVPNLIWASLKARLGFTVASPYRLAEMAQDAMGILDGLGIEQAHIVGISMGGMISQRIAIAAPSRVLSLTSIMSSSGAPGLPGPRSDVARAMLSRPKSAKISDIVDRSMSVFQLISSPAYPQDLAALRERLTMSASRSYHPQGMARQMLAIVADSRRYRLLEGITSPTLVIHGVADPLVPIACGRDTAQRIKDAHFVAIDGMGHDWPPAVTAQMCQHILPHLSQASMMT